MRFMHTMLRVGNLDRSIDFYTKVLGMKRSMCNRHRAAGERSSNARRLERFSFTLIRHIPADGSVSLIIPTT